ncbi:MAG: hypothetical protein LBI38_05515 [Oscillospiraceae bacterium]|jgi:hypothetical protein|nr:hypothetical protein [Oscillospiraceae bacterium]
MSVVKLSVDILLDGNIPPGEVRRKWEETADFQTKETPVKGKPFFRHGKKGGKFTLSYYRSYGSDICDAAFKGEIYEYGDGGCCAKGKITSSPQVRIIAAVIFAVGIILALLCPVALENLPFGGIDPNTGRKNAAEILPVYPALGITAASLAVSAMSLAVDRRKARAITDYLQEFISGGGESEPDDKGD